MNWQTNIVIKVSSCLLLATFLVGHSQLHATTKSIDTSRTAQKAEPEKIRPVMPDGLYLVERDVPFLLIENGRWRDPYEWIEKNGIELLNTEYVLGKQFERIHIHTQLGSIEAMKLYSLSATDMLRSSKIINETKFDLKKLAPRISAERCANDGRDLWSCQTDLISKPYFPAQTKCNTGSNGAGCPTGITARRLSVGNLLGENRAKSILQLDADALHKKIEAKFHEVTSPKDYHGLIKISVFTTQVFRGASGEQQVAGFLNLEFEANANWARSAKWQRKPIGRADLAFIWSEQADKFVFLQRKKHILSEASQSICDKGLQPHYCPIAKPLGMWEVSGKTYAAIRYEQFVALWHYPPDLPMNELDRKGVRATQIEVVEVGSEPLSVLFSTRPFIATY